MSTSDSAIGIPEGYNVPHPSLVAEAKAWGDIFSLRRKQQLGDSPRTIADKLVVPQGVVLAMDRGAVLPSGEAHKTIINSLKLNGDGPAAAIRKKMELHHKNATQHIYNWGKLLVERREELGLTLEAVAADLNVPAETLDAWEHGHGLADQEQFELLSMALDWDPAGRQDVAFNAFRAAFEEECQIESAKENIFSTSHTRKREGMTHEERGRTSKFSGGNSGTTTVSEECEFVTDPQEIFTQAQDTEDFAHFLWYMLLKQYVGERRAVAANDPSILREPPFIHELEVNDVPYERWLGYQRFCGKRQLPEIPSLVKVVADLDAAHDDWRFTRQTPEGPVTESVTEKLVRLQMKAALDRLKTDEETSQEHRFEWRPKFFPAVFGVQMMQEASTLKTYMLGALLGLQKHQSQVSQSRMLEHIRKPKVQQVRWLKTYLAAQEGLPYSEEDYDRLANAYLAQEGHKMDWQSDLLAIRPSVHTVAVAAHELECAAEQLVSGFAGHRKQLLEDEFPCLKQAARRTNGTGKPILVEEPQEVLLARSQRVWGRAAGTLAAEPSPLIQVNGAVHENGHHGNGHNGNGHAKNSHAEPQIDLPEDRAAAERARREAGVSGNQHGTGGRG